MLHFPVSTLPVKRQVTSSVRTVKSYQPWLPDASSSTVECCRDGSETCLTGAPYDSSRMSTSRDTVSRFPNWIQTFVVRDFPPPGRTVTAMCGSLDREPLNSRMNPFGPSTRTRYAPEIENVSRTESPARTAYERQASSFPYEYALNGAP